MSCKNLLETETPQSLKSSLNHNNHNNNSFKRDFDPNQYDLITSYCSGRISQPKIRCIERDFNSLYFQTIPTNIIGNTIIVTSSSKTNPYEHYMQLQRQQQQIEDLRNQLSRFLKQESYQEYYKIPSFQFSNRNNHNSINRNLKTGKQYDEDKQKIKALSTVLKGKFETEEYDRFQEKTNSYQQLSNMTQVSMKNYFRYHGQSVQYPPFQTSNDSLTHSKHQITGQETKFNSEGHNHFSLISFVKNIINSFYIPTIEYQTKQSQQLNFNRITASIVFIISYFMYILTCLFFGSHLPSLVSQLQSVSCLFLALAAKILFIFNKRKSTVILNLHFFLGFGIYYLATIFYLQELMNFLFSNSIHSHSRFDIYQSFRTSIGIICTYFFFRQRNAVEDNLLLSNNGLTYSKIICTSFQQQKDYLMKNALLALLSIILGVLIFVIQGNEIELGSQSSQETLPSYSIVVRSISELFGCDSQKQQIVCSISWLVSLIYLFALSQVVLFSLATSIIINLKSKQ